MSTLTVSNVSDGSLTIPTTYVTNGSAKAWINFNGTGTIAARDSLNVSSLTDKGAGDYGVNFTNAFSDTNYALAATKQNVSVNNDFGVYSALGQKSAATDVVLSYEAGSLTDTTSMQAINVGDLA